MCECECECERGWLLAIVAGGEVGLPTSTKLSARGSDERGGDRPEGDTEALELMPLLRPSVSSALLMMVDAGADAWTDAPYRWTVAERRDQQAALV